MNLKENLTENSKKKYYVSRKFEIPSNNFNFNCLNIFDYSNRFLFSKAIFQPINLNTYIERIIKKLLVDIYWLNKAIWKINIKYSKKDVLLCKMSFQKAYTCAQTGL